MIFLVLFFCIVLLTLAACRDSNRFWRLLFLIFFDRLQGNVTIDLISFNKRVKCFFSLIFLPFLATFVLVLGVGRLFGSKRKLFCFLVFSLLLTFLLILSTFFVFFQNEIIIISLPYLFELEDFVIGFWVFIWWFNFVFFEVCILMLFVIVFLISLLVHIYSFGYLEGDPHLIRFFSLFNFIYIFYVTCC